MEIKVCKALKADIASPYVWVSESLIHADDHRRYFRITRPAQDGQGKTSIVCQVYRAGADYKRRFKESRKHVQVDNGRFIVMSEHYRNFFDRLEPDGLVALELERIKYDLWGAWLASKYNPDKAERLALLMGIWSLVISLLSVFLGLMSLWSFHPGRESNFEDRCKCCGVEFDRQNGHLSLWRTNEVSCNLK